jgi:hypothetical protein
METHDAAYVAGLIDGEGHLRGFLPSHRRGSRLVSFTNTHKPIIDWVLERTPPAGVDENTTRKGTPIWIIRWTNMEAITELLTEIRPYMRIKADQADALLDNISNAPGKGSRRDVGPRPLKTHCKNGHEFTEDNTQLVNGYQRCRTCNREWQRAHRAKKMTNLTDYA